MTIDHKVVMHQWRHETMPDGSVRSEKFYTVEMSASTAAELAEMLHQASVIASRVGESPAPDRLVGLVLE